jgi:hypothetical protein
VDVAADPVAAAGSPPSTESAAVPIEQSFASTPVAEVAAVASTTTAVKAAIPDPITSESPIIPSGVVVAEATAETEDAKPEEIATPPAPVAAQVADPIAPRRRVRITVNAAAITGPLNRLAVGTLVLMNAPLKVVPTKFKPAVDLVAMSLVLWVPLAFILPPKFAAWNAARAAAAHTTGAVHAESSNAKHAEADDHGGGGHEAASGHGAGH